MTSIGSASASSQDLSSRISNLNRDHSKDVNIDKRGEARSVDRIISAPSDGGKGIRVDIRV